MNVTRTLALVTVSSLILFVWAFPVLWGLLTSFKTEVDVLAYPPVVVFKPTPDNYLDVLFGPISILPNLLSSFIVAVSTTLITLLLATPAAYGFARLRFRAKKPLGFYTLVTQMIPPVGLVIPYFLILNNLGWLAARKLS